jgi:peptidoglycan/LPS O-acetylase OafA/YrhL
MFGVALSYLYHVHPERFRQWFEPWRRPFVLVGIACFVPAFIWPLGSTAFIHTVGLTLFQVGGGLLVVWAMLSPSVQRPLPRLFAWIGAYSYSIYLWHMVVIVHLEPQIEWKILGVMDYPVRFFFTCALALAVGVVMAKLVEMPVLRVRDRWFPSRTGRAVPAVAPSSEWAGRLESVVVKAVGD